MHTERESGSPPARDRATQPGDQDEAAQIEWWSRALADTTVEALVTIQATTSPTQVRALLALDMLGPCSNADLARALSIFPSSATRITDRLTAAGLAQREVSESSRREVRLVLTPAGRRSLHRFVAARQVVIDRILSRMNPADRAALGRGLRAFTAAAGIPASGTQAR